MRSVGEESTLSLKNLTSSLQSVVAHYALLTATSTLDLPPYTQTYLPFREASNILAIEIAGLKFCVLQNREFETTYLSDECVVLKCVIRVEGNDTQGVVVELRDIDEAGGTEGCKQELDPTLAHTQSLPPLTPHDIFASCAAPRVQISLCLNSERPFREIGNITLYRASLVAANDAYIFRTVSAQWDDHVGLSQHPVLLCHRRLSDDFICVTLRKRSRVDIKVQPFELGVDSSSIPSYLEFWDSARAPFLAIKLQEVRECEGEGREDRSDEALRIPWRLSSLIANTFLTS